MRVMRKMMPTRFSAELSGPNSSTVLAGVALTFYLKCSHFLSILKGLTPIRKTRIAVEGL